MGTRNVLNVLKLHSRKGSCNFENFQNISSTYESLIVRNGRAISYTNSLLSLAPQSESSIKVHF